MEATIIGGAIAGLTTANLLQKLGISYQIYEATEGLQTIGAGIILSPNALYILDKAGLLDQIKQVGHHLPRFDIANFDGRKLQHNELSFIIDGKHYEGIGVHRGELQRILLQNIPHENIHFSKRVKQILPTKNKVQFSDNKTISYDYLLGCDGIHSTVRAALFPKSSLRYSGQSCWRGVVNQTAPSSPAELWGCGLRFGFVPIASNKTYWYATAVQAPKKALDCLEELADMFVAFAPFVKELIINTTNNNFMQHDLEELRQMPVWSAENILLMGDAAHAMTPNLGQGAAQSIEDAWAIMHALVNTDTIAEAFQQYHLTRYKKVTWVTKQSWRIGQVSNWQYEWVCALRNMLFAYTPTLIMNKQKKQLYSVIEP